MHSCNESKDDCGAIEAFIWDAVCVEFGDFAGVKCLNTNDILKLRTLCDLELASIIANNEDR